MNKHLHFSSVKHDYETPKELFDLLDQMYGPFDFDAAANADNAKCANWVGKSITGASGLTDPWSWYKAKKVWLNPPYGRGIGKWLKKAYMEAQEGCRVVCLIPSRTDTKWWQYYVMLAKEVLFISRRVKFVGQKCAAPFPSAVVIFEEGKHQTKFSCLDITHSNRKI